MKFTVIFSWALACAVVSATLLARHLIALPAPKDHAKLERALAALGDQPLAAPHFLYAQCKCSKRIVSHLLERFGVPAAPLLVVRSAGVGISYAGGYTTQKQGERIFDDHIMASARRWR